MTRLRQSRSPGSPGNAGYSGTPLGKKLGVKESFRIKTRNAPAGYARMLEPLPDGVAISQRLRPPIDLWHIFSRSRVDLARELSTCLNEIKQGGMIWVSWPKKTSGVASDLTEDVIRELALPKGLVDVKVCAIDAIWSGLKLVIRKELRR
ncbi:MAG TPA: DUF3052 domain-containing protein [Gammaproteobacteria bacterium]|jgi:hypothetical protein